MTFSEAVKAHNERLLVSDGRTVYRVLDIDPMNEMVIAKALENSFVRKGTADALYFSNVVGTKVSA